MAKKFNLASYVDAPEAKEEEKKNTPEPKAPEKKEEKAPAKKDEKAPEKAASKKAEPKAKAKEDLIPEPIEQKEEQPKKNLGGRPSTHGPNSGRMSIYLSGDVIDHIKSIGPLYENSASKYIETLIREDMERNKEKYDELKKFMQMINK